MKIGRARAHHDVPLADPVDDGGLFPTWVPTIGVPLEHDPNEPTLGIRPHSQRRSGAPREEPAAGEPARDMSTTEAREYGWKAVPFVTGVPFEPVTLFRWVTSEDLSPSAFVPDNEATKPKPSNENHATYRGISVYNDLEVAIREMGLVNAGRRENGRPEFSHIAAFELRPPKMHAFAQTYEPPEHCTVWAPPDELHWAPGGGGSSPRIVYPIPD